MAALRQAHAASFDCSKAQTSREKLVCADKELDAADTELGKTYAAFRAKLSPAAADLVKADQTEWLHWLDRICTTAPGGVYQSQKDCVKSLYSERQTALGNGIYRSPAGQLFFTRSHYVLIPGKKEKDSPDNDPGYGTGDYLWPQIDRPDPDGQAWNAAAAAEAIRVVSDGKARTLDAANQDSSGTDSLGYTIDAANRMLIGVNFEDSTYGYGAAHPQTGDSSFLYWIAQHRAVTVQDIFLKDAPWQTKLNELARIHLQRERGDDGLWKGEELRKGIESTVGDMHNWSLSRQGLGITFGQYAVAPYASGMPDITIRWSELTSLLNPAFKPETLPSPVPPPK